MPSIYCTVDKIVTLQPQRHLLLLPYKKQQKTTEMFKTNIGLVGFCFCP